MNDKQLRNLDFNSLKLLKILGEELNTKRTAERMYLSQPAISKALKKLRGFFDDELFNRKRHGLEATPFCEELLRKLPLVFDVIGDVFTNVDQFEPSTYTEEVSIAISTSCYRPVSRQLYSLLRKRLPRATIKLINWGPQTEHDLKIGRVNVGINYYPLDVSKELSQKKLTYAQFKLVCRVNHPVFKSEGRLKDIGQYPLALLELPDFNKQYNLLELKLIEQGITPKVHLRADQLSICLSAIEGSDVLLPCVDIFDVNLPSGTTLFAGHPDDQAGSDVGMFTSVRTANTPLIRWLTQELELLFRQH